MKFGAKRFASFAFVDFEAFFFLSPLPARAEIFLFFAFSERQTYFSPLPLDAPEVSLGAVGKNLFTNCLFF